MSITEQNQTLAEISETIFGDSARLEIVDPESLVLLKKNARYFKKETFRQLVSNLKKDRRLSSVPLCHVLPNGLREVLSGNHRVKAAIEAGIKKILIITLLQDLNRSEKISIQLSHNALVGEDDVGILSELWAQIDDINAKIYAGLSSTTLDQLKNVQMISFTTPALATRSLSFVFTEYEREMLDQVLEELARIPNKELYVFPMDQFSDFFELLRQIKEKKEIKNGSLAMVKIIEIISQHLKESEKC